MRVRFAAVLIAAIVEVPLFASYPARDLYVPIAGRGIGANGRVFHAALWITNLTQQPNGVTVSFLAAGQANPHPRSVDFVLAGGETRIFDPLGTDLVGASSAIGALHITSRLQVMASCRTFTRLESDPLSRAVGARFSAIPARFAIGNGEATLLHGASIVEPAQSSYRIYVVEAAGQALSYSVELVDLNGRSVAQKPFFIGPHEQRTVELATEFPAIRIGAALARIRGLNGNGRIIVAGGQVMLESRDTVPYEMSFTAEPMARVPLAETITYIAVVLAVIVAAWFYRR